MLLQENRLLGCQRFVSRQKELHLLVLLVIDLVDVAVADFGVRSVDVSLPIAGEQNERRHQNRQYRNGKGIKLVRIRIELPGEHVATAPDQSGGDIEKDESPRTAEA